MSIKIKLILGFAFPIATLLAVATVGYQNVIRQQASDEWVAHTYEVLQALDTLLSEAKDMETGQRGFLITGVDKYLEPFESGLTGVNAALATVLELTIDNPNQQQRLGRVRPLLDDKIDELRETIELRRRLGFEAAQEVVLNDAGKVVMDNIRQLITEALDEEGRLFAERVAENQQNQSFAKNFIVTSVGASLLLIGLIVWSVLRSILGPLGLALEVSERIAGGERNVEIRTTAKDEIGVLLSMMDRMQTAVRDAEDALQHAAQNTKDIVAQYTRVIGNIATGDLTKRLEIDENDDSDLAQLGVHLNTMTDSLADITGQIAQSSEALVSTLAEVNASISQQAAAAAEQAASVSETSTTLKEIEATADQTLEKAQGLGESAVRAQKESEQGLEAVEETINGMEAIRERVEDIARTIMTLSEQSQQIGDISEAVTKLAQQSKILALNASIEAAKAGEAGKGFAVVAVEVKELAEQSQQSIDKIQKILQDIRHATDRAVMVTEEGTKGVDSGVTLVQRTGKIMRELSEVVRETSLSSQQIVAAVRQEAIGINQVGEAMREIDTQLAQSVAANRQLEEANASMLATADALKTSIQTYRLAE